MDSSQFPIITLGKIYNVETFNKTCKRNNERTGEEK